MTEKKSFWVKVKTFFSKWQRFIPIVIGAILGGYIIFLLVINYVSQVKTQEFFLQYVRQNIENQTIALNNFFHYRIKESTNLALSREIDIYFENKALGMSMEYGLKNSLFNMEKNFADFADLNEEYFHRSLFINTKGELLVDCHMPHASDDHEGDLSRFLNSKDSIMLYISETPGRLPRIVVSIPYFFKDEYKGHVLTWIRSRVLSYNVLLGKKPFPEMYAGLMDRNDNIFLLKENSLEAFRLNFSDFKPYGRERKIQNMYSFKMKDNQGDLEKMLAFKTEIEDMPFCLLVALPKSLVLGRTKPVQMIFTLGSAALFFIVTIIFLMRLNLRNAILRTRLEEGKKRRIGIEEKVKKRTFELSEVNAQLNQEIHERKEAEDEIETQKSELEVMNKDLISNERELKNMMSDMKKVNEELKEMQSQLLQSEKMAATGQLSAGVAHEIKNPLAIILMSIESLEGVVKNLDEKSRRRVQMITDAAERANKIVNELLVFSRQTSFNLEKVNLREIIAGVVVLARNIEKVKDINISEEFKEDEILLDGDYVLLEQAFFNLFINSIDAMDEGGNLGIKVFRAEGPAQESSQRDIIVEVSDTGGGIPEEQLKDIFTPFFTTKEPGKGTGLGLSIVYMIIVERHNGNIKVESKIGEGTKVIITLPASQTVVKQGEQGGQI